jgi:hypothetical protein
MKRAVAILVMAACVGLVLVLRGMTGAGDKARASGAWPFGFTMEYEESGAALSLDRDPLTRAVLRFAYRGQHDWRIDTLSNDAFPQAAGSWSEYSGHVLTTHNTLTGESSQHADEDAGVAQMPEEWLVPGYVDRLLASGGSLGTTADPALLKVTIAQTAPCVQGPGGGTEDGCENGLRHSTREVHYRSADKLPVRIVDMVGGATVKKIQVTSLTVQP